MTAIEWGPVLLGGGGRCPLLPSLIPSLPIPFRAGRFVRQVGLGCVQGGLEHGDSEGALFEQGTQAGVSDRTKALVATPVCMVEEVRNLVCWS